MRGMKDMYKDKTFKKQTTTMKTTFAAAAFAGFALAQKGGMRGMKDMYKEKDFGGSKLGSGGFRPSGNGGNNAQFLTYLSTNNKSYSTPREMALRAQLYNDKAAEVRELNRKLRASGRKDAAKFETNFLSDLTAEEKKKLTGWREDNRLNRTRLYHQRDGRGRRLIADATTVDHVKDGNMGAVKDQGYCGSCWAFAANTVLEGQVKIKTGVLKRISEQHLVDCSLHTVTQFNTRYWNYGCNGGWMSEAWKFQKNEGYMHNEDYKYESDTTYTEGACRHNNNKIIGNVTKIGKIDGSGSLEGLKEQVKKGPMTIASMQEMQSSRTTNQVLSRRVTAVELVLITLSSSLATHHVDPTVVMTPILLLSLSLSLLRSAQYSNGGTHALTVLIVACLQTLKETTTTGRFRTLGALGGAMLASLSSLSRKVKESVA